MSAEQQPAEQQPNDAEARPAARFTTAEARQRAEFILSRAWGLLRSPDEEWRQIQAEETSVPAILAGYVAPLAAIPPIFGALGDIVFGQRFAGEVVRASVSGTLIGVLATFLASVALVYFLGVLINAIADNFEGEPDSLSAQKVAAYAMTPAFASGVFSLWPPAWWLSLVGIALTAFLFFRGLPPLMRVSEERALGYAATVMVCALVAFIVLFSLAGCFNAGSVSATAAIAR